MSTTASLPSHRACSETARNCRDMYRRVYCPTLFLRPSESIYLDARRKVKAAQHFHNLLLRIVRADTVTALHLLIHQQLWIAGEQDTALALLDADEIVSRGDLTPNGVETELRHSKSQAAQRGIGNKAQS